VSIRRDYKPAATGQRRQSARRNGLLVITLVLIGLFGGLLAYIKGDRTRPAPATAAAPPSGPTQPSSAPATPPPKATVAPVAESAPVKPKYDFYTELPKRRIHIRRETDNPGSAPQPSPSRLQPAADPLRKPAAPRKNTASTTPTVVTTSSAKPNAKPANAKPTKAELANAAKPANAKPANVKPANVKPANVKPAKAELANAKPASTPTPARTTPPPKPLANSGSKVAVKTEPEP
jgi:hypothetical protein